MISASDTRPLLGCTFALLLAAALTASYAGNEDNKANKSSSGSKKSISIVVKKCSDHQTRSLQIVSDLIEKLSAASRADDSAQMKAAIEDAKTTLSQLKSEHVKCRDALLKVHQRLETLRAHVKAAHQHHERASNLVEDEDMDEVIWAE
jgi:hypothetical protein